MVIDNIHRFLRDTFTLISRYYATFATMPQSDETNVAAYPQMLLWLRMVEIVCQYIELAASYSVACKKTGLLYPPLVLDINPSGLSDFLKSADKILDTDIQMIFNPNHLLPPQEIAAIRERYKRISVSYTRYWSLYNAIKHGMRILPLELTAKAGLHGGESFFCVHWVVVTTRKNKRSRVLLKKWDGAIIPVDIQNQDIRTGIFPRDLGELRASVEDCSYIVDKINQAHNPPWLKSK
jgi:hypothetical protein